MRKQRHTLHRAMENCRETFCGRRCDQLEQLNRDRTETWVNGEHKIRVVYDDERTTCVKCQTAMAEQTGEIVHA